MQQRNNGIARGVLPQTPSTFSALRHRNFRLWFFGQMVSTMGTWMQSVAQGWLVYEMTGSKLALGTVSFLGSLPTLFLMIPAGALGDRIPKRKLLLTTQTAMMALAFILAFLAATGQLQVWHIAVLALCLGVANSFDAPVRHAMVADMVDDRRDLFNAVALNSTLFNVARIVGPAVGGVLLAYLGAAACFALNGLSFLAVIVALWLMRFPPARPVQREESLGQQTLAGLRYIRGHEAVRAVILLVAVSGLFGFFYATLMPAIAADVLRVGEQGLGVLNAAIGVGALVGSLVVASLGTFPRRGLVLTIGSVLFPIALLCFASARSLALAVPSLILVGLGFMMQNATANTLVQSLVPDELRARVMAVYILCFFGTSPFAAILAGGLAQAFGPARAIGFGAAIFLIFALFMVVTAPLLRRLET